MKRDFIGMLQEFAGNRVLVCAFISWFSAQLIKYIIDGIRHRGWRIKSLFSSGGMPSSHSASAVALATAVGLHEGFSSGLFAACAPISGIGNTDQGVKQTYLWVFQGAKDRWVKLQNGLRVALKCEQAGCNARHYVYGDEGHDIQTMVFQDVFTDENGRKTKLIDWLMSKKTDQ